MGASKSVRKIGAVVTAALFASLGLTGCGQSSSSEVTIEYWHRLPDKPEMIKVADSAQEFTKANPNIKVKTTKFDGDATKSYEKITASIKAGNAPCLAQVSYNNLPDLLVRGELMDVTKEAAQYKGNYAPGAWAGSELGGKTYGIPQDTGPLVYFYDKDAFDKLGLKPATTWDEYWQNAEKAKSAGKFTSFFPKDDPFDFFGAVVAANGGSWYSTTADGAWKVTINSDISKQTHEQWQKSIDAGTTLNDLRWDETHFDKAISDGKLIGYVGAGWEAAFNLAKLGKDSANWQVAQLPGGKSGPWGGSAVVVLKGCKHPAEALKFANWYNTNLKAMASQGIVNAAKGTATTPEPIKKLYGGQDVMAELAKANEGMNPNWLFAPSWTAVSAAYADAVKANTPLPKAADIAQKTAEENITKSGIKLAK